jgi:uncharacterized membrane protein
MSKIPLLKALLEGRFLGYPIHPLLVHFPLALFPTSLLFDLLSLGQGLTPFVKMAFYTMVVGEATGAIAAVTGAIDWFTRLVPGTPAFRVATLHALLNVGVLLSFGFNLGLRVGPALERPHTPPGPMLLSVAGVSLLAVANHLGGRLVYHYGVGVRRTDLKP